MMINNNIINQSNFNSSAKIISSFTFIVIAFALLSTTQAQAQTPQTYVCADSELTCGINKQASDWIASKGFPLGSEFTNYNYYDFDITDSDISPSVTVECNADGSKKATLDLSNLAKNDYSWQAFTSKMPFGTNNERWWNQIYYLNRPLMNTGSAKEIDGWMDNQYREFWRGTTSKSSACSDSGDPSLCSVYENYLGGNSGYISRNATTGALTKYAVGWMPPYDQGANLGPYKNEVNFSGNRINFVKKFKTRGSGTGQDFFGQGEYWGLWSFDLDLPPTTCSPTEEFFFDVYPDNIQVQVDEEFEIQANTNKPLVTYCKNRLLNDDSSATDWFNPVRCDGEGYSSEVGGYFNVRDVKTTEEQVYKVKNDPLNTNPITLLSHVGSNGLLLGRDFRCYPPNTVYSSNPYASSYPDGCNSTNYPTITNGPTDSDFRNYYRTSTIRGKAPSTPGTYGLIVNTKTYRNNIENGSVLTNSGVTYDRVRQAGTIADTTKKYQDSSIVINYEDPETIQRNGQEIVYVEVLPVPEPDKQLVNVKVECSSTDPNTTFNLLYGDSDPITGSCENGLFIPNEPIEWQDGANLYIYVGYPHPRLNRVYVFNTLTNSPTPPKSGSIFSSVATPDEMYAKVNSPIESVTFKINIESVAPEAQFCVDDGDGGCKDSSSLTPGDVELVNWTSNNTDTCEGNWSGADTLPTSGSSSATVPSSGTITVTCYLDPEY